MKTEKLVNLVLASSVAAAFSMAAVPAVADTEMSKADVKCFNVNSCKGKTSCKTAKNSCKGMNYCRSKGMVMMSKEACEQVGGKVGK